MQTRLACAPCLVLCQWLPVDALLCTWTGRDALQVPWALDGVACAAVALASLGLYVPFVAVESDASLKEAAFSCFAKTWHFGDVLDFRVSSLPSKLNRAQFWMVPVAVPTHVLASSLMCSGSLTRLALSVQCLAPRHLLYLGECPASAYFILKCCIQGLQQ